MFSPLFLLINEHARIHEYKLQTKDLTWKSFPLAQGRHTNVYALPPSKKVSRTTNIRNHAKIKLNPTLLLGKIRNYQRLRFPLEIWM